jgi:hypothetical protein
MHYAAVRVPYVPPLWIQRENVGKQLIFKKILQKWQYGSVSYLIAAKIAMWKFYFKR